MTAALPKATLGLRLTLLSAFLHYALGMTTRNICFSGGGPLEVDMTAVVPEQKALLVC